ncbi:MAG: acetyl-CoA carboxylase biotin carboxylase subunit [bacterium]|nr:acetyl-CoA carboxylase biotin carboxylase subunit [bacterium]
MFSSALIANRGEIAVRVIRTCREMGIRAIAVYSEVDRDALHVRLADEAYALGGQTSEESYLNVSAILAAIDASSAEAVHPGYGFLSENADFARRIVEMGVTFIGPPPEAIEQMGDKISARRAAERVGVASVPGSPLVQQAADVAAFAAEHSYPVAVKAAYGGGGRGLKVVNAASEIDSALESARREALAYFGRDELYLERYLPRPRHVEVQVLADSHGNCVYLGTRDCSAQRRHQKLIEEAPAPDIAPAIAAAMGEAAVTVAEGCGYTNAGTVEFLYQEEQFWYLEMNTRLQVEHPATEMICGLDLVEQQIRVAAGEPLSFAQSDVELRGHAIEVRINAEDPAGGHFLPSPGRIAKLVVPDGFGTRFDTGYEAGDEISPLYDNLVGKLICWGTDRPAAIRRTLRALEEMEVVGVATTIPADEAILSHPDFASVTHTTRWVTDELDLSGLMPMQVAEELALTGDTSTMHHTIDVEVNAKRYKVKLWMPEGTASASAAAAGQRPARRPRRTSGGGGASAGRGDGEVRTPMQGTVVKVLVAVGDTVATGDPVVVLEAMKMENNLLAACNGTVREVRVAAGDLVGGGDLVVLIEAA